MFNDLLESGWIDSVSIDVEKNVQIIRLLDAAVIKLEGGTDLDLESLDIEYEEPDKQNVEPSLSLFNVEADKPAEAEKKDSDDAKGQDENGETSAAVKSIDESTENQPDDVNGDVAFKSDSLGDETTAEQPADAEMKNGDDVKKEEDEDAPKKPRHLHKTASIFLRNIAPSVSRKEIEDVSDTAASRSHNLTDVV